MRAPLFCQQKQTFTCYSFSQESHVCSITQFVVSLKVGEEEKAEEWQRYLRPVGDGTVVYYVLYSSGAICLKEN
jgi:hypothetical protein